MRVLIACEFSGVVRRAFVKRGHDAYSCDLLDSDDGEPSYGLPDIQPGRSLDGKHYKCDVLLCLNDGYSPPWDLIIAFPPCTHLAVSGARWFKDKVIEQKEAISFFMRFLSANCQKVAIENPIGIMSTHYRKPDQIIQPWQFGHGETKSTCLWLKNLPKLVPTNIVEGRHGRVWREPPGPDRWKKRSITYQGIADAMAEQWGNA